jgi:hypothetical protein
MVNGKGCTTKDCKRKNLSRAITKNIYKRVKIFDGAIMECIPRDVSKDQSRGLF